MSWSWCQNERVCGSLVALSVISVVPPMMQHQIHPDGKYLEKRPCATNLATAKQSLNVSNVARKIDWFPDGVTFDERPPWVLPDGSAARVISGTKAAVHCNFSCRKTTVCAKNETKHCFVPPGTEDAACQCRPDIVLPTEWVQPDVIFHPANRTRVAVLMAGQVRSLANRLMQDYWKLLIGKLRQSADVVVFAVLSRRTFNKISQTPYLYEEKFLKQIMSTLNVTWIAEFPVHTDWNESAVLVHDPALRFLLSPPNKKLLGGGLHNGYRARVVAFDLMLRFETAHQRRFTSVVFVRPDVAYSPNVMIDMCIHPCEDAVSVNNDIFALMPRKLAVWYFTHLSTRLFFEISRLRTNLQEEMKQAGLGSWHGGALSMPSMHLVFHGIPVHGTAHEFMATSHSCYQRGGRAVSLAIMRDLPNPNDLNSPRLCCAKGACQEFLQTWLQNIEMDPKLLANLDANCSAAPARKKMRNHCSVEVIV